MVDVNKEDTSKGSRLPVLTPCIFSAAARDFPAISRPFLQWDNFLAQMEPITSTLPYMLTEGNHERV